MTSTSPVRDVKSITVFCGASEASRAFTSAAQTLGAALAQRRTRLIYGGASTGLMGVLADSCLEAGGEVIGVIPNELVTYEVAHLSLSRLEVVDSMHSRKARMSELGDAFIALPGGFGTADEVFEMITWLQLGLHSKPMGLLSV